jgi:hypothetical protein
MRHATVNFVVACAGFVLLLAVTTSGIIIKYVLPRGSGRRWRGGRGGAEAGENIRELLSMPRHQWLDIHFWLAVAFVVLVIIHILLHWSWFKSYSCSKKLHSKL